MRFVMSKKAQDFFGNIIAGEHGFSLQFDIYYCCALVGMTALQRDDDMSGTGQITDKYPQQYNDCKAQIAGLLVASEAKRLGIDNSQLEKVMLDYLSNNDTMLSDEGIKALNAYSLKGYYLIRDNVMLEKPDSKEEFLEAFYETIKRVREY